MSLISLGLDKIPRSAFTTVSSTGMGAESVWPSLGNTPPVNNPILLSESTAQAVPAAWACVQILSGTIARLPKNLVRGTWPNQSVVDNHPVLDLMEEPEAGEPGLQWWMSVLTTLFSSGNAYVWIRKVNGAPIELIRCRLLALRRQPRTKYRDRWVYDLLFPNGQNRVGVKPSDVLHFRGPGYDWELGLSPSPITMVAMNTLGLSLAAVTHMASTMGRSASFPRAFGAPEGASPQQIEAYLKILKEQGGPSRAGQDVVMPPGFSMTRAGFSAVDLQLIDLLKFTVVEIARTWMIPLYLLQHFESSAGVMASRSYEEQWQSFLRFSLAGNIVRITSELNFKLLRRFPGAQNLSLEVDTDPLTMGSLADRAAVADQLVQKAALWTVTEGRELTGKPPLEDESELRQPTGAPPQGEEDDDDNGTSGDTGEDEPPSESDSED